MIEIVPKRIERTKATARTDKHMTHPKSKLGRVMCFSPKFLISVGAQSWRIVERAQDQGAGLALIAMSFDTAPTLTTKAPFAVTVPKLCVVPVCGSYSCTV